MDREITMRVLSDQTGDTLFTIHGIPEGELQDCIDSLINQRGSLDVLYTGIDDTRSFVVAMVPDTTAIRMRDLLGLLPVLRA
jgi:hypothetical protein